MGSQFQVYTDGSCLSNPGGPGGWAALLLKDGAEINTVTGSDPSTTNNRMEMLAALNGLYMVPSGVSCEVISDSLYVVNTMLGLWSKGKNQDLWELLDRESQRVRPTWRWVKGHGTDAWNIKVDRLAKQAAQRERSLVQ